jgi:cysteine synthase A
MRGCQARRGFLARPVDLGVDRDQECCSFSCRIPGVLECSSELFREADESSLSTIEVTDEEAIETTRALIRMGFPVGPSSGLNLRAAVIAAETAGPGSCIVTVFPDRMERYFTTELFRPFTARAAV